MKWNWMKYIEKGSIILKAENCAWWQPTASVDARKSITKKKLYISSSINWYEYDGWDIAFIW